MKKVLNTLTLTIFDAIALLMGYRFKKVNTLQECYDANQFYEKNGGSSEQILREKVKLNRPGKIHFIAYHKGQAVGAIRLSDPWLANQGLETYGQDEFGIVYEMQNLLTTNDDSKNASFILLGLFRVMFGFSVCHSVLCWNATGMKNVCRMLNSYRGERSNTSSEGNNFHSPMEDYLHTKKIKGTTFSIDIAALDPFTAARIHIARWISNWEMPVQLPTLRLNMKAA